MISTFGEQTPSGQGLVNSHFMIPIRERRCAPLQFQGKRLEIMPVKALIKSQIRSPSLMKSPRTCCGSLARLLLAKVLGVGFRESRSPNLSPAV